MSSNRGMTAIEVLLALALSSIVISLLFMIFFLFTNAYKSSINAMDAQYSARIVIFNINNDIRCAKQIGLEGDRKIIITKENETISYYLESDTVYRHSKVKIPIAEKVADLRFNQQDSLICYSVTTGMVDHEYIINSACAPRVTTH